MKKCISMILLLAMMLSLAVVGTVGTTAYSDFDQSKYYGCYATTTPTIDGEIDEIWSTTVPMYFTNETWGYVKLLWSEDAIYFLADLAKTKADSEYVDFFVTTKAYDKNWAWSWTVNDGCHYVRCNKDADSSSEGYAASGIWYLSETTKATNATVKAISKADGGFVAEVKIPLGTNDATMQIDTKIGFGASVGGDMYLGQCVGLKDLNGNGNFDELNSSRNAGALYAMQLHSAPVYQESEAPTCTAAGIESGTCSGCAAVLPSRTVDALGHDFAETATVDVEPTLIEKGSQSHHCSRCDVTENASEIDETTIQYVGVQTTDVTNNAYNARFVAQIAELEAFSAAGFEVSLSYGKTLDTMCEPAVKTLQTTDAYTSIQAGAETATPTAEDGGKYLIAVPITDIPVNENVAYVTFVIKPFTVSSADGSIVYATGTNGWTITLYNGIVVK